MSAVQSPSGRQRGAVTLFLSLLMLLLITVLVTTAFTMSTTGLRSVGNMQARNEAIAAAQLVIETELGGPFYTTPAALSDQTVDINNDGTTDYTVNLGAPECVRAAQASTAAVSSVTLPGLTTTSAWITTWEFEAVVTDPRSGAQVTVVQAVRAVLSQSQKDVSCA
jgi:Tfp pilus assembly protein PilX